MDGHRPAIITHVPATITGLFRGRARRYLHRRRGELVGCWVFAYWMAACPSLSEFRPRIGVRGMLSIVGMKITRMARFPKKCASAGRLVARPWLGTSPSATSLFRPSAAGVRANVVGVAGRRRNPSRIGVRDMLSYQRRSQDWSPKV